MFSVSYTHLDVYKRQAPYFDTRLAHYLLQPEMRHRLSDIALNVLGLTADDYADADAARKPYGPLPAGKEVLRLGQAADLTGRLRLPLLTLLRQNSQEQLLDDIELPLAAVLADMEWNGVRIDVDELKALSETLSARLRGVEEEVYDLAGEKFNIGSPSQVGEILFGKLALDPKARRTKTGAYSTTEEILLKHRAGNQMCIRDRCRHAAATGRARLRRRPHGRLHLIELLRKVFQGEIRRHPQGVCLLHLQPAGTRQWQNMLNNRSVGQFLSLIDLKKLAIGTPAH